MRQAETKPMFVNAIIKKMNKNNAIFLMLFTLNVLSAQDTIMPLWPNEVPNQVESKEKEVHDKKGLLWMTNVQKPTIEVYLSAKQNANGQAVLIFPGGGYQGLAYDWEGTDIAKTLNSKGVAGIVVKYRSPLSKTLTEKQNVPLQDAQRAIRLVKSMAKEWNIDENKIGIAGFSAGGHLASTLGTHFMEKVYAPQDEMDSISARPDFMILVYPVITFKTESTHMGSRTALLNNAPTDDQIKYYSNELWVNEGTPPTFLAHAIDDDVVPVENSILFFQALKKSKVPTTMHIYPDGGHGFSLALDNDHLKGWMDSLFDWLESIE